MNDIAPAVLEKIQGSPLELDRGNEKGEQKALDRAKAKEKLDEQRQKQRKKEKKKQTVEVRRISFDGLMRAKDVELVTALSRVSIWRMEREKKFPGRVQVSPSRVAWRGCEVKSFIDSRPVVELKPPENEY